MRMRFLAVFMVVFCAQSQASETVARELLKRMGIACDAPSLFKRIERDDSKAVKLLLKAACLSPNHENEFGVTPLMFAAEKGSEKVIEVLLETGAKLDVKDKLSGKTALMRAAENGHPGAITLMAKKGADLNARTEKRVHFGVTYPSGNTALILAASQDQIESVRILVQLGADPNARNDEGSTALSFALKKNNPAMVDLLQNALRAAGVLAADSSPATNDDIPR